MSSKRLVYDNMKARNVYMTNHSLCDTCKKMDECMHQGLYDYLQVTLIMTD